MAGKIDGIESRPVRVAPGGAVGKSASATDAATRQAAQQARQPAATPEVQITGAARTMAALEQSLKEQPSVDERRVASVRKAVEEGSYTVDAGRIADSLLRMERDLQTSLPVQGRR
ncbi:MAG: Anti-sigma-28 factor, FlgM [Pseudomonadota bacterium]|jgi:negative regulator of flagellin synthesis FlgM